MENEEIKKEEVISEETEMTVDELNETIENNVKTALNNSKNEIVAEVKSALATPEMKKADAKNMLGEMVKSAINLQLKATPSTSTMGSVVPTEVADYILEGRDAISIWRKGATIIRHSGKLSLPSLATGVSTYWVDENATITASEPTTSSVDLDDWYLAGRVLMPRKLANTSNVNLASFFEQLFAKAIAKAEDVAFTDGDGTKKPTGLRTSTLPVSQVISQASTSLAYDDIVNLVYSVKPEYREGATFQTSSKGCALIRKIKDLQGQPIFDVASNRIFGKYDLEENPNIPDDLGTGADETEIFFGDKSAYFIKDGEELTMKSNEIIGSLQTEIVVYEAVDGVLSDVNAFGKLEGVK